MARSKADSAVTKAQERALMAKILPGETPIHAHWEYYVRLMRET